MRLGLAFDQKTNPRPAAAPLTAGGSSKSKP